MDHLFIAFVRQRFSDWLAEAFDGMGSGFGGWYSESDMEQAYRAGYEQCAKDV